MKSERMVVNFLSVQHLPASLVVMETWASSGEAAFCFPFFPLLEAGVFSFRYAQEILPDVPIVYFDV